MNTTKMTFRRCIKGQIDKMLKMKCWKELLKDIIVYMGDMLNGKQLGDTTLSYKFDRDKIVIVSIKKETVITKTFPQQQLNDSRLANHRTVLIFKYINTCYYIVFDNNRSKIYVSVTNNYNIAREMIVLYELDRPFICIKANLNGELDPRIWRGVPFIDSLEIVREGEVKNV